MTQQSKTGGNINHPRAVIAGRNSDAVFESGVNLNGSTNDGVNTASQTLNVTVGTDPSSFLAPSTSSLHGKYGVFTFDSTLGSPTYGEWDYQLDNARATTNRLGYGQTALDTLKITALDGTSTRIEVTVNGSDDAPILKAGHAKALVEAGYGVTGNDTSKITFTKSDPDRADHANWVAPDTIGWTHDSGTIFRMAGDFGNAKFDTHTGVVSYKLDNTLANTNQLEKGETAFDTFDVTVVDDWGVRTTTSAVFTINGQNDAPLADLDALPPNLTYTKNTVSHFAASTLLHNFSDPEGDNLTISRVLNGTGGTVKLDPATHAVNFTPATDYTGEAHFWYVVSDGQGKSEPEYMSVLFTTGTGGVGDGGSGSVSPGQSVTIDSMTRDTGLLADDFITNDGTPGVLGVSNRTVSGQISAELTGNQIVEVSFDNGANWNTASINPGPTQWLVVDPGTHSDVWTIKARVTDLGTHLSGIEAQRNVTLDTEAPTMTQSDPLNATNQVDVSSNIVLTFPEDVHAGTGNIVISSSNSSIPISMDDTNQVTFSGGVVTIHPTFALQLSTMYSVTLQQHALADTAGNYNNDSLGALFHFRTKDPDPISGTTGDNILDGTNGNDTISGLGGSDQISGNLGNDRIIVPDLGFAKVDGGEGVDTLVLSGPDPLYLDLKLFTGTGKINDIEVIDLTGTAVDPYNDPTDIVINTVVNSLELNAADLIGLSTTSDALLVRGDAGDHVNLAVDNDILWKQVSDQTINGATYAVWTHGDGSFDATLLVGVNIIFEIFDPAAMVV